MVLTFPPLSLFSLSLSPPFMETGQMKRNTPKWKTCQMRRNRGSSSYRLFLNPSSRSSNNGVAMNPPRNFIATNLPGLIRLRRTPMREFCKLTPPERLSNGDISKRASTRRYSVAASVERDLEKSKAEMMELCKFVSPSVVALLSYFSGTQTKEIPYSVRRGTGFFVAPTLIATSARVVGRVSTFYDSVRRSVLHNCFLARTIAFTGERKVFCTRPVAVNFASDVAVLEVLNSRQVAGGLPPPLSLANSVADARCQLMGVVRHGNVTVLTHLLPGSSRSRLRSKKTKAPWPLDDKVEWIDYGACEKRDSEMVSLSDVSGSPWFNFEKEVVGVASWAAEEESGRINGYAMPPSSIRLMVNYAKSKGAEDPIVVDRWINELTIAEDSSNVTKECLPTWPHHIMVQMYV